MLTHPKYSIYTVRKKSVETLSQVLALENGHFQKEARVSYMNLLRETPLVIGEHKQGENKDLEIFG